MGPQAPRIDKDLLLSLKEDLIVVSSGIKGEIASVLLNEGEEKAKKLFIWWKENFKSDFYIQLSRHTDFIPIRTMISKSAL